MPVLGVNGYETLDVGETAGGLTATTSGAAFQAGEGRVEDAAIRYRVDGTTVTSDTGHIARVGDVIELKNRGEVALLSVIRDDDAEADGRITFALGVDWKP